MSGLPGPSHVVLFFGVWCGVSLRILTKTPKKVLQRRVWVEPRQGHRQPLRVQDCISKTASIVLETRATTGLQGRYRPIGLRCTSYLEGGYVAFMSHTHSPKLGT